MAYRSLNESLKETFGCKVYKLSLDGGMTCPNRDGTVGTRGCIFCSGAGEFAAAGETVAFDHGVRIHRPPYSSGAWLQHPFTDYLERGDLTLFQGTVTAYEGDFIELLRATSNLGPGAGANHPTPEGAMIGEICHEYALRVGCQKPLTEASAYHAGCVAEAGKAGANGILPHKETLAAFEGGNDLNVVSLKPAWDGNGNIVRAFNPGEAAAVTLKGSLAGDRVIRTNLSEKTAEGFDAANIPAKAYGPLTVRMQSETEEQMQYAPADRSCE